MKRSILALTFTLLASAGVATAKVHWEATAGPPLANTTALLTLGDDLLAGFDSLVFRSTDQGATWSDLGVPFDWISNVRYSTMDPNGNWFVPTNFADSAIARSTDRGATWTLLDVGANVIVTGRILTDANGWIYAFGQDPTTSAYFLLVSRDGGVTWEGNPANIGFALFLLHFIDPNGRIWASTGTFGSSTWTLHYSDSQSRLFTARVADS
jgi:photosystem II stability/assembly factor-like uncharacterized protein